MGAFATALEEQVDVESLVTAAYRTLLDGLLVRDREPGTMVHGDEEEVATAGELVVVMGLVSRGMSLDVCEKMLERDHTVEVEWRRTDAGERLGVVLNFEDGSTIDEVAPAPAELGHCGGCTSTFVIGAEGTYDDPPACSWACWQEALELARDAYIDDAELGGEG